MAKVANKDADERARKRGYQRTDQGSSESSAVTSFDISKVDATSLKEISECLGAAANLIRLRILSYCVEPRTFSDVMREFRLNTASVSFHLRKLLDSELLEKKGAETSNVYRTTELGSAVLGIVGAVNVARRSGHGRC
jgi:predicted transcriptional regulator